jgi:hypothetical protein
MTSSTSRPTTLAHRLDITLRAATNALADPEIATRLARRGFGVEALERGRQLCELVAEMERARAREQGEQYQATAAVQQARHNAEQHLRPLLRVARMAFEGDAGAAEALGLRSLRTGSTTKWIARARMFYSNAMLSPAIIERLARYNITELELAAGKDTLDALEEARRVQDLKRGSARDALQTRNAAVKEFDAWAREFKVISDVALDDRPALRAKLGLHW